MKRKIVKLEIHFKISMKENNEDIRWITETVEVQEDTLQNLILKNRNIENTIKERVILKINQEIIRAFWLQLLQIRRNKNINLALHPQNIDLIQVQETVDLQQKLHTLQNIWEIQKTKFLLNQQLFLKDFQQYWNNLTIKLIDKSFINLRLKSQILIFLKS